MRNFIINSVKYWADEYHIDGFRFDLMAIHDMETMNKVAVELKKINPSIFVYGEGWTAGDSPLPAEQRALKENVGKMRGVAVFSDDIRDAVKGHYSNAADRGFATGKPGNEETVKIGIVASTKHPQVDYGKGNNSKFPYASAPTQIINYVSCLYARGYGSAAAACGKACADHSVHFSGHAVYVCRRRTVPR